jgi:hypothetical protein
VEEGSASVDYLFSPLQGARFAVEPLPALAWSECPACRGIGARISVEYSISHLRRRGAIGDLDRRLARLEDALNKLPKPKTTAGNRERNFSWVICLAAEILLKHGIEPTKRGSQFYDIVKVCFDSLCIEREVQSAITKAWPEVENLIMSCRIFGTDWRTQSDQTDFD